MWRAQNNRETWNGECGGSEDGIQNEMSWWGILAMNHDEFIASKRQEIVSVSRSIMTGEINIVEGIRKICALRMFMDNPEDEVFLPIRAIDSETDHFPTGTQRANWAPESLKKLDQQVEEYLADAREDIYEACREIIRLYSD
jgi:hypothetical protein